MEKVAITILRLYQVLASPILHQLVGAHACRYSPTCSEYARIHIQKDGMLVGTAKSILRLLYCQPFAKHLPAMLTN